MVNLKMPADGKTCVHGPEPSWYAAHTGTRHVDQSRVTLPVPVGASRTVRPSVAVFVGPGCEPSGAARMVTVYCPGGAVPPTTMFRLAVTPVIGDGWLVNVTPAGAPSAESTSAPVKLVRAMVTATFVDPP